jgi:hypothetical protein
VRGAVTAFVIPVILGWPTDMSAATEAGERA